MKKIILLLIIGLVLASISFAQDEKPLFGDKPAKELDKTDEGEVLVIETPVGERRWTKTETGWDMNGEERTSEQLLHMYGRATTRYTYSLGEEPKPEPDEKPKEEPEPEKKEGKKEEPKEEEKKEEAEPDKEEDAYYLVEDEEGNWAYSSEKPKSGDYYEISGDQTEAIDLYSYEARRHMPDEEGNIVFYYETDDKSKIYRLEVDSKGNEVAYRGDETTPLSDEAASELYDEIFYERHPEYERWGGVLPSIASLQYYYKRYSGMSGWSSLLFDEDTLSEWKKDVNEVFCDFLATRDCWVSKICERYYDLESPEGGVMYAQSAPTAVPRPFAHIEGERGLPIKTEIGTVYIYKVTFGLSNPKDKAINYHITLRGSEGAETVLESSQLAAGQIASAIGAEARINESNKAHFEVCLHFDKIETVGGKRKSRVCNNLAIQ